MNQEPHQQFIQDKQRIASQINKLVKRAHKRVQQRHTRLQECQEWPKAQHEALLLQANLYRIHQGMQTISVLDWEQGNLERTLSLDPLLDPSCQIARAFKRCRKLRLGIVHAVRQVELAEQALADLEEKRLAIEKASSSNELENLLISLPLKEPKEKKQRSAEIKLPPKPYFIFFTESDMQVWVGKNAKNNDLLTFHYAKGSDWWLHARDYPGSHVVLKCNKGQEPDERSLRDAAELALRYSQAGSLADGEVSVTQVKHLGRIKGSPGKVHLRKHKVLHVRLDPERWLHLQLRKHS